jgi:twitching motility protein PilT
MNTSELHLPTNLRSRLATAVWMATKFAAQFTDLILIEDSPIYVKSARGTVELSSLGVPGSDFKASREDIQNFFAFHIRGISTREDSSAFWKEHIAPILGQMSSVSQSIKTPDSEFIRFSLYQIMGGKLGMTIRVTPPPRPISESGLPNELIDKIAGGERGLLVLTGPTASGKTATALSLLEHLNATTSSHIVTIEDPIEFSMKPRRSVFSQREVGVDVGSFAQGLREALRMSPDVLLVGEVRDAETAETAILAGESGALVIITTHGQSANGTLSKMLSLVGDAKSKAMRSVLAGSLLGVVRQELVPTETCSEYVLVTDYLRSTKNVRSMVENGDWDNLAQLMGTLRSSDHSNMNAQLYDLVKKGVLSGKVAMRHSSNKASLREVLPNA